MSQTAVRLNKVSITRGQIRAVDNVTLNIRAKQTTAVLGGSGSGKSTLIQLMIGLLIPDSGTVETLQKPLTKDNLRQIRRKTGYALQEVALLPHLTVGKNIALPAALLQWTDEAIHNRILELLKLIELPESVLERYAHELSGGQQQRAGLCRAMMLRPELLLLDEPFSGLDTLTRQEIHQRILELQQQEDLTIVIVTHDPLEARKLAQSVAIMRQGKLLQHASTDEVFNRPANDYVRKLLDGIGQTAC